MVFHAKITRLLKTALLWSVLLAAFLVISRHFPNPFGYMKSFQSGLGGNQNIETAHLYNKETNNSHDSTLWNDHLHNEKTNNPQASSKPILQEWQGYNVSSLRVQMFSNIKSFFFSPLPEYSKYKKPAATYVFGINTVFRPHTAYLIDTLTSLITNMTSQERHKVIIIVSIVDQNQTYIERIAKSIEEKFKQYLIEGLLEVTSLSPKIYESFDNLPLNFGDSVTRIKWRTKQCYDDAYLMIYSMDRGLYYIQTEDDCIATTSSYITKLDNYLRTSTGKSNWLMLDLAGWGSVGKMFHAKELPSLAEYILLFAAMKPIDWLFSDYISGKVCPVGNKDGCRAFFSKAALRFFPKLLKHMGAYSTLPDKAGLRKKVFN